MPKMRVDWAKGVREKFSGTAPGQILAFIILGSFLLRLTVFLSAWFVTGGSSVFYQPDSLSYIQPARELLNNGAFAQGGAPMIFRTPGYPLLLIPGILAGHLEAVTILLQISLSCATVWLVHRTVRSLSSSEGAALIAAVLYAIEPLSITYSVMLVSETLFTFWIMLLLYLLVKYLKEGRISFICLAALSLAASVYTRPIGYYLPLPIAVFLIFCFAWRKSLKARHIAHAVLFVLICQALVGIWQWRNFRETGYSGMASVSAYSVYYFFAGAVQAKKQNIPYYRYLQEEGWSDPENYFSRHPEQRSWSQAERLSYMTREGLKTLADNPFLFLRIAMAGLARNVFDPGAIETMKLYRLYPASGGLLGRIVDRGVLAVVLDLLRTRPLVVGGLVLFGLVLLQYYLAGAALFLGKGRMGNEIPWGELLLLLLVAGYFLALASGASALGRFRHPSMPAVAIWAAFGYRNLYRIWRVKWGRWKRSQQ